MQGGARNKGSLHHKLKSSVVLCWLAPLQSAACSGHQRFSLPCTAAAEVQP